MGRRVEKWTRDRERRREERRLDAIAHGGATGGQPAAPQPQAQENPLGRESHELDAAKVNPNNPLGRDIAEVEEAYRQQRIERTLNWLRGMSQQGGTGLFGGGIFGPGGPRRLG